jgi:peptide deformylase
MANYVLAIINDATKLQERCDEVNLKNPEEMIMVTKIVNNLKDTLRANINLPALSAPQLGYKYRIFCIKFANGDIRAFINPLILSVPKNMHLSREICPSVSNTEYIVPRCNEIEAAYQTPVANNEVNKFMGAPAEVFQQMMNLIDGVLISDIGLEILPGFDNLSDDDKEKIIQMYLDSLKNKEAVLSKEVENNPSLKKTNDAINFMTDLALGKIKTEPLTKEETDRLFKDKDTK